jgi:hypothetical protein
VSISVVPDPVHSGHVPGEVVLIVRLRNDSAQTLRFSVDESRGAPFKLDWAWYRVLVGTPGGLVADLQHALFADGQVSTDTLRIGPGDSTTLRAFLEHAGSADCSRTLVIELRDQGTTPSARSRSSCAHNE